MYRKGQGVSTDDVRYYQGKGVRRDYAEAVHWHRKAANQGDATAQFDLGSMYSRGGEGVPLDYVRAHMWMSLAASRASGDLKQKYARGRDLVAKEMTTEQIAEAERLAREWKPRGEPTSAGERDSQR